jgi:hypothetical protein
MPVAYRCDWIPIGPRLCLLGRANGHSKLVLRIEVLSFDAVTASITETLQEYVSKSGKSSTDQPDRICGGLPVEVPLLELLHSSAGGSESGSAAWLLALVASAFFRISAVIVAASRPVPAVCDPGGFRSRHEQRHDRGQAVKSRGTRRAPAIDRCD